MPSITTHNIFAKKVFDKMEKSLQKKIQESKTIYEMFSQSFDFFYFYSWFDLKNGRKIRRFGNYCHKSNTQAYLINIIRNIKSNKMEHDPDALAYLYGSINHYVLDSVCHPLVFFKTGCYYKNIKGTHKYKGLHTRMEKQVDAYFYEEYYHKSFYKYNIVKEIIPRVKFKNNLLNLVNKTFKDTYNKENMGIYYNKSYNNSRIIYRLVTYDRLGIKKFIYRIIDFLTQFKEECLINWSYHNPNIDKSYLNLEKKDWCNPTDINDIHNESFPELIELSVKKSLNIIKAVNKVLSNKMKIEELNDIIPNISYTTGKNISSVQKMNYFEF